MRKFLVWVFRFIAMIIFIFSLIAILSIQSFNEIYEKDKLLQASEAPLVGDQLRSTIPYFSELPAILNSLPQIEKLMTTFAILGAILIIISFTIKGRRKNNK